MRLKTQMGGSQTLIPEPETMTIKTSGQRAASIPAEGAPAHYLRRVARSIVIRAALRGRLSWHAALPMLSKIGGAA